MEDCVDTIESIKLAEVWEHPTEGGDECEKGTIGESKRLPKAMIIPTPANDNCSQKYMENLVHCLRSEAELKVVRHKRESDKYKEDAD